MTANACEGKLCRETEGSGRTSRPTCRSTLREGKKGGEVGWNSLGLQCNSKKVQRDQWRVLEPKPPVRRSLVSSRNSTTASCHMQALARSSLIA